MIMSQWLFACRTMTLTVFWGELAMVDKLLPSWLISFDDSFRYAQHFTRESTFSSRESFRFAKVDITAHSSLEYDFSKASATKEKGTLCENLWGKILTHFQSTWQEISPLLLFIIHEAFRLSLLQNWLGSSKVYSCVRKTSRRKLWTILGLERMTKRIIFPTRDDDNANGRKENSVAIASSSFKIDF